MPHPKNATKKVATGKVAVGLRVTLVQGNRLSIESYAPLEIGRRVLVSKEIGPKIGFIGLRFDFAG